MWTDLSQADVFFHIPSVYLWKEHLCSLLSQPVPELIGHQVDTKLQFIKN